MCDHVRSRRNNELNIAVGLQRAACVTDILPDVPRFVFDVLQTQHL